MRKRIIPVLVALILLLASCATVSGPSPEDSRTVLKIGGTKINHDYYRYVFMNTWNDLSGGNTDAAYADYALQTEINDAALETLLRNTAIEKLAKKYGVSLSTDEKNGLLDWIEAQRKAAEKNGDDFDLSLRESYMTEYTLYHIQCFNLLWSKIYVYVTDIENGIVPCSEQDVRASFESSFYRIKYVMISCERDNALEIARTVAGLTADTEFEELIALYNDDPKMAGLTDGGYYFITGEIIEDVESAVRELDFGQVSPIIDTELGYFIVKRYEPDPSYLDDNYAEIEEKHLAGQFNKMVEELMGSLRVSYTKVYNEFTVYSAK